MFIQGGATFHLLILDSKNKALISDHEHYEEVQTGWQDVFSAISSATGGTVLQETGMADALKIFSRQQDIYYILTYEPANAPRLKRKVKLELPGKNYELFYNNEGIRRQIGKFAISGIDWQEPVLKLKIENYRLDLLPQGIAGRVSLTIRMLAKEGKEMTSVRELVLTEKNPEIELKLKFPAKGDYHLFIEAADLLGADTASVEKTITWSGIPTSLAKPEKKAAEIIGDEKQLKLENEAVETIGAKKEIKDKKTD